MLLCWQSDPIWLTKDFNFFQVLETANWDSEKYKRNGTSYQCRVEKLPFYTLALSLFQYNPPFNVLSDDAIHFPDGCWASVGCYGYHGHCTQGKLPTEYAGLSQRWHQTKLNYLLWHYLNLTFLVTGVHTAIYHKVHFQQAVEVSHYFLCCLKKKKIQIL